MDTPRSRSRKDTPRSYVRRGLNPGLERVVIRLDSMSGEDTPQSCVCMGENISIPDFSNSSSAFQDGSEDALKVSKKDGDELELRERKRGASRMEMSTITLKAR